MKKPIKILNGYAGLGGNRKKWSGNIEVTAVEIDPKIAKVYQNQNPNDTVIIGDVHEYLLKHFAEFDFIWLSAPCQTHSKMVKATRHKNKKYPDMSLYQEIILLKELFKGKYLVENVKPYYEPLIKPNKIMGRHIFWTNLDIPNFEVPSPKGFINKGTTAAANELKEWLGIHYEGNIYYKGNHCPGQVLRNCVHPDLGKHIFDCLGIN